MLLWASYLLSVYTTPDGISSGLKKLLSPFRFLGLPVNRISSIISISWSGLPAFRERVRATIREREKTLRASGKKRNRFQARQGPHRHYFRYHYFCPIARGNRRTFNRRQNGILD